MTPSNILDYASRSKRFAFAFSSTLMLGATTVALATGGAGATEVSAERPLIYRAAGVKVAAIQMTVDDYRKALGRLNDNNPGSVGSGRREINWDGVPEQTADPNQFPSHFLNARLPGRARGVSFFTPGRGRLVSAGSGNPTHTPIEFGRINPIYLHQFATFSPPRLFTAVGKSNVVDVAFFIPGSTTRAATTGFGAVFTNVDPPTSSKIDYSDRHGRLLHRQAVPSYRGAGSLSFAGVAFKRAVVWRVRVTSGNAGLGARDNPERGIDVTVMDDFIYGEPR